MKKTKQKKQHSTEVPDMPQMPFDDAIAKILSAPHQPKVAKKGKKRARN